MTIPIFFNITGPTDLRFLKKKKLLIPSSFPSNINMHFMEEIDLNVSAWKKTILETNVSAWKKMILGTTIERTSSCIRTPSLIMVLKKSATHSDYKCKLSWSEFVV